MSITILTLLIIAGIVLLMLTIALFTKKGYNTHRATIIFAHCTEVFDYLKQIKNQDNFNKWVMVDPDMEKTYVGTDGNVGFIYSWNGNKEAGKGEQEIKVIHQGEYIETEIRFKRPFKGLAFARMATEALSGNHTRVTWTTSSRMKYPINLMLPIIVRMLEKDMDESLVTLKNILEK